MSMPIFLRVAQYFGFFATLITCVLLIWLILTKASNRFGAYKWLMFSYSVYSVIYAFVEIFTQPIMHVWGTSMFLYVDSALKSNKILSSHLSAAYCASFGLCISLLATHFVYRYFAVCRPNDLHHFDGLKLLRLFILPAGVFFLWYTSYVILLGPSDFKSEYMKDVIMENYNEDSYNVGYIAVVYYYTDPSGTLIIRWIDFTTVFTMCGIMGSCISIMVACGWMTYRKLKNVGSMSKKTKELNNQLFKTLILQTFVPLFTMFIPVGLILTLPMFSIGVGTFSNAPGMYASLYPALDACIAIFMIRDFRDTVLCRRRHRKNAVNTTTTNASNNNDSTLVTS